MDQTACNGKLKLELKQKDPIRVAPEEETEKGHYLLCNLDQNIAVIMRTIYLYKSQQKGNEDAVKVVKESLAKVLVPFYPLAGRLTISPEGKLIVDCTGEGPLFVEAENNCSLLQILGLASADPMVLKNLVYDFPGAKNIIETPLFTVQVSLLIDVIVEYVNEPTPSKVKLMVEASVWVVEIEPMTIVMLAQIPCHEPTQSLA